ncbi:MAG: hypothetical protein Q8O90_06745 [Elusimicrobiota bacterium]|nr:hypothetical protein [Elusimicrobiota bacterium]
MKHITKPAFLCLFAVLFWGCLPHEKLIGRVIDTAGPVPEAAVLAMVWIEDADKARPKPDVKDLKPEERDAALEKDMKDRGLPVAYARTFADKDGWFALDNFHFSAETKKAVKAMKQPKITRVTMWAFQRGYRKQAVTLFPKQEDKEVPRATLLLFKPAGWKELYLDNIVNTLTQPYMVKGYSKEFGATEQEKDWLLKYTHSNLWKAYVDSDIKGDKELEEMCGRDYSDMIISDAGIQRNPDRERCADLIKRMGAVREIEELWIAHIRKSGNPLAAAREVVKRGIALLPAEVNEPVEYESLILAGLEDAANIKNKGALRNGLADRPWQEEAAAQYGRGDKAAAYRALGYTLYNQLPDEIQEGVITAQLSVRTIPGIKETAAGFYLLMNKPLTAQLPNGDNGNHKDKPGYKVDASTETADKGSTVPNASTTKKVAAPKTIKLGGDDIDVEKVYRQYWQGEQIGEEVRNETFDGRDAERKITKKAFGQPNSGYFAKVENQQVEPVCEDCEGIDEEKSKFELYAVDGKKVFEKDLDGKTILHTTVLRSKVFLLKTAKFDNDKLGSIEQYEIYGNNGELLYELQNIADIALSPQADYLLLLEKIGDGLNLKKLDLQGKIKLLITMHREIVRVESFSDTGEHFVIIDGRETVKVAPFGKNYREMDFMYFKDDKLLWTKTLEAEAFNGANLSKSAKYLIVYYGTDYPCVDIVVDRRKQKSCKRGRDRFKVFDVATQQVLYDELKDEKLIQDFKNEVINKKQRR